MPATQAHILATTPSHEIIAAEFPTWQTGTSVLRDAAGNICGTLWFTRCADGVVMTVGPVNPATGGEPVEIVNEDDTWW